MRILESSSAILSVLVLLLSPIAANASGAIIYDHVEKATISGHKIQIINGLQVNIDCSAADAPAFQIAIPPMHGRLSQAKGSIFPNFSPPSPVAKCDGHKISAIIMYYTPTRDFVGHDFLEVRIAYSGGGVRDEKIDIDVK